MRQRFHAGITGTAAAPWFSRFAAMFSGLLNPGRANRNAKAATEDGAITAGQ